jgi:hypothetical protein
MARMTTLHNSLLIIERISDYNPEIDGWANQDGAPLRNPVVMNDGAS